MESPEAIALHAARSLARSGPMKQNSTPRQGHKINLVYARSLTPHDVRLCNPTKEARPLKDRLLWTLYSLRYDPASIAPASEFYSHWGKLDFSGVGRRSHGAITRAGDAGVGIAPTYGVERVIDVHPELCVEPVFDRERLTQRDRFHAFCQNPRTQSRTGAMLPNCGRPGEQRKRLPGREIPA